MLATRSQYPFAGSVIAQRSSTGTTPLVYLHSDQIGSVSIATAGSAPTLVDTQEYLPLT
jgi:hypothetical protein